MRKRVLLSFVVLVFLVSLLAAACGGTSIPKGAIATVGSGVVTQTQFDAIIRQAKTQSQQPGQTAFPKAGTYAYNQYAAQVVTYLVTQEIINQAATEMRVTVTDKQIKDRIAQLEKAYNGKAAVDKILKQQGMTRADLTQLMKDQLLDRAVYNKVVASAKVTDAQAQTYYDKNKSSFNTPETRTMRHILVKTKAQADQVRALLAGGADWKTVAKKYSIDPGSKNNGGSLGVVKPGAMVPAFDKAAFALKVNVISQPVKTQFGWHVIQVTKIVAGSSTTFEKAKAQIKSQLLTTKQQAIWSAWLKKRTAAAKIKYADGFDPTVLKATKQPTSTPTPAATGTSTAAPTTTATPTTSASASPYTPSASPSASPK
jgi:parvulin-like peptidyl-prolyl isomerase